MLIFPYFLSSRPFFRLARLAKLAGHNAKDGLSQHGILGFGNENTAENTTTNNENDASKTASTTSTGSNPGRSRWGNLIHVSYGPNYLLH